MSIWNWIVTSSADPNKLSLTLKAGIPFIIMILGWQGVDGAVVSPLLGEAANQVANSLVLVAQLGTAAIAAYGLARKIYFTVFSKQ
jgi:hypothetical protein